MSIFFHGRNMDENDQEFFIIRLGQGSGSFYSPVPWTVHQTIQSPSLEEGAGEQGLLKLSR